MIKTYFSYYYGQKALALILGVGFLGVSIYGYIYPEKLNHETTDINILNLLPFFLAGTIFLVVFIWMANNLFRIKMDNSGIIILKLIKNEEIKWAEIESIKGVGIFKTTIFKIVSKEKRTLYFRTDKPYSGFQTKMGDFIKHKKQELGI